VSCGFWAALTAFGLLTSLDISSPEVQSLSVLGAKELLALLWVSFLGDEVGLRHETLDMVQQALPPALFYCMARLIWAGDMVSPHSIHLSLQCALIAPKVAACPSYIVQAADTNLLSQPMACQVCLSNFTQNIDPRLARL
jgi:hypothetical protein